MDRLQQQQRLHDAGVGEGAGDYDNRFGPHRFEAFGWHTHVSFRVREAARIERMVLGAEFGGQCGSQLPSVATGDDRHRLSSVTPSPHLLKGFPCLYNLGCSPVRGQFKPLSREWARPDLNRRPPGYQPGAPTNLSYPPGAGVATLAREITVSVKPFTHCLQSSTSDNSVAPSTSRMCVTAPPHPAGRACAPGT